MLNLLKSMITMPLTSVGLGFWSECILEPHQQHNYGNVNKPITAKQDRRHKRFCGACNNCKIIISYAHVGKEALRHFSSHKISSIKEVRGKRILLSHWSTNRWVARTGEQEDCLFAGNNPHCRILTWNIDIDRVLGYLVQSMLLP